MRILKTSLAVIGAVTVLVLAGNTISLAATGQALLLGKSNSANNITAVTRTTAGSALKLQTASSANSPLTVNGKGKVTNLNADTVDGFDSTVMRNKAYIFTKDVGAPIGAFIVDIPLPSGSYTFAYSALLHTTGTTGNAYCQVSRDHGGTMTYYGLSQIPEGTADPAISAGGAITRSAGDLIQLTCQGGSNFTTQETAPVQIVFSPTTVVGTGVLLREAAPGRRTAGH